MAYVRSLREIPLDQEPHASVLAALLPDIDESPGMGGVPWHMATAEEIAHLRQCPDCLGLVGGSLGRVSLGEEEVGAISSTTLNNIRARLLKMHNDRRRAIGRPLLVLDGTLNGLALRYSNEMASHNWWNADAYHHRYNGWTFAQWWNYYAPPAYRPSAGKYVGENIARGYVTNDEVFRAWMNSPSHKANIENTRFRRVGFGATDARNGVRYWTAHFSS